MEKNHFVLNRDIGILILRIIIGFRLLYGVVDNIVSSEKMAKFSAFLESFGFPFPMVSAHVSVYFQFFAGISILVGFKLRLFAMLMIFNFIIALVFVHLASNDTVEGMTPALAILFSCLALFFTGAGKFSLNYYFSDLHRGKKTQVVGEERY